MSRIGPAETITTKEKENPVSQNLKIDQNVANSYFDLIFSITIHINYVKTKIALRATYSPKWMRQKD